MSNHRSIAFAKRNLNRCANAIHTFDDVAGLHIEDLTSGLNYSFTNTPRVWFRFMYICAFVRATCCHSSLTYMRTNGFNATYIIYLNGNFACLSHPSFLPSPSSFIPDFRITFSPPVSSAGVDQYRNTQRRFANFVLQYNLDIDMYVLRLLLSYNSTCFSYPLFVILLSSLNYVLFINGE